MKRPDASQISSDSGVFQPADVEKRKQSTNDRLDKVQISSNSGASQPADVDRICVMAHKGLRPEICKYFVRGICRSGHSCRFVHLLPPGQGMPANLDAMAGDARVRPKQVAIVQRNLKAIFKRTADESAAASSAKPPGAEPVTKVPGSVMIRTLDESATASDAEPPQDESTTKVQGSIVAELLKQASASGPVRLSTKKRAVAFLRPKAAAITQIGSKRALDAAIAILRRKRSRDPAIALLRPKRSRILANTTSEESATVTSAV